MADYHLLARLMPGPIYAHRFRRVAWHGAWLLVLLLTSSCEKGASTFEGTWNFGSAQLNPNGGLIQLYRINGDWAAPDARFSGDVVPPALRRGRSSGELHIFHFNDLHHRLNDSKRKGGPSHLAKMAALVKQRRRQAAASAATLFISAGDDTTGSRFDNLLGDDVESFRRHAGYQIYSQIGVDAAVLGNHEFDRGHEVLQLAISHNAAFPVLSSNLLTPDPDWPAAPAVIGVASNGLRVAMLGLTPTAEIAIGDLQNAGFEVLDNGEALRQMVNKIQNYADVFLIISHLGLDTPQGDKKMAAILSELLRDSGKPGVIIGAHDHIALNVRTLEPANVIDGIPVLQAGAYGQYLGYASVDLKPDKEPHYRARLFPIAERHRPADIVEIEEAWQIQRLFITPLDTMLAEIPVLPIGHVVHDTGMTTASTLLDRYSDETLLANLITDAVVSQSQSWPQGAVDIAVYNSTGIAGGIEQGGVVNDSDLQQVLPYHDSLYVVDVSGQALKDIIISNAQRLRGRGEFIPGGGDLDPMRNHETGFLHFSQRVRYSVVTGKVGVELPVVRDITIDGTSIDLLLNETYRLALPQFLAIGRGKWNGDAVSINGLAVANTPNLQLLAEKQGRNTGHILRYEVQAYLREHTSSATPLSLLKDQRLTVKSPP